MKYKNLTMQLTINHASSAPNQLIYDNEFLKGLNMIQRKIKPVKSF